MSDSQWLVILGAIAAAYQGGVIAVIKWLADNNKAKDVTIATLNNDALALLKAYRDRDEEDRRWRQEQERRRTGGREPA